MNENDKEEFLRMLIPMSAIYGVAMPEDQIVGYWMVLKPMLTIDEFRRAVGIAASTLKFMPKPSELIDCVKPSRALLAWETFAKVARRPITHSIDFGDPLINAVVRSKGGLREAYRIPSDTFYSHYRRDFLEAYRAFERGTAVPDTSPLLVSGHHEGSLGLPGKKISCSYLEGPQLKLEAI